jgi:hypothetical protein
MELDILTFFFSVGSEMCVVWCGDGFFVKYM